MGDVKEIKIERDKYLTEKMGYCWHDWHTDFSTWEGFGKLWEWCTKKASPMLFEAMEISFNGDMITQDIINPDKFADAVYEFLKQYDLNKLKEAQGEIY